MQAWLNVASNARRFLQILQNNVRGTKSEHRRSYKTVVLRVSAMSLRTLLGLCGLSAASACSPEVRSETAAVKAVPVVQLREEVAVAPSGGTASKPSRNSATATAPQAEVRLARMRTALPVLSRFWRGRLELAGGCVTVFLPERGRAATAVFPPDARLVYAGGKAVGVSFGARTIPIGRDARIPGGGSVSPRNLAAPLSPGCPRELFPIGG
ncbi:MAG: hypothetical protein QOJ91_2850 [Sphingomonadales bacterium]|jgi:hypothetical protein|nr:hypothetical protein [Sphingomonadales bacterium]